MKKGIIRFLLAAFAAAPVLAIAAANDLFINQRTSDNQATITRTVTVPSGGQSGLVGYNGSLPTQFHAGSPVIYTLGPGLTLTGSVLDVVPGSVTWASISGKPNFSTVATTGQYSDLLGRPALFSGAYADLTGKPTLFSGIYADLTGIPSTFAPSPHTHAASDIVSGVLADARIPSLSISKTNGLQSALDAKLATPAGTTSQYLRGDGTLATFPAIPTAQVQVDWNATSGIASIANKPALAPVATAGTYSSLTGIPSTFPPSAHSQAWSTTWASISGKPNFSTVATTGQYSDLLGRPALFSGAYADLTGKPTLFSGIYADLTGIPSTFAPSPHTHAASDIVSGVLADARIPSLSISKTNGLQSALDAKLATPAGTTSQYLRGDGTLATFPAIPTAQVQVDWNATSGIASIANKPALAPVATAGTYSSLTGIPSTFPPSAHSQAWSTITATPTTLSGYGITDGVSQSALTAALGSYATNSALTAGLVTKFNVPTGTTAQYVRGDGSLATLPVARRIETYSGTTNASGQITVTYPTAYPVAPVVQPPAPALANQVWTTVASTTTGFTMQLNQRNTVTLLAVEVLLGATVPVNGTAATFLVVAQ